MSFDDVWAQTQAGGGGDASPTPNPGQYIVRISSAKFDTSKAGEKYLAIEYTRHDGYTWADVRVLTKDGNALDGRIKAAKILMRGLGIPEDTPPAQLAHSVKAIEGRCFAVDVKASEQINSVTGTPYLNTNIIGPANGTSPSDPGLPTAAAAPAGGAVVPATEAGNQPVAGPAPQQVPVPAGAQFGENPGW